MFPVHWNIAVLDRLAELYVAAPVEERVRMAAGLSSLNRRLAEDPLDVGESRDANGRVAFPALLMVRFRIDVSTRTVRVTGVSRFGR